MSDFSRGVQRGFWALLISMLSVLGSIPRTAAGSFQIVNAGPYRSSGQAGTPVLGEAFGLKVYYILSGAISNPYRVRFQLANQTALSGPINLPAGWSDTEAETMPLALDDEIPWSITIDPDGVSGCPSVSISGTFVPVPPSVPVELYDTQSMRGSEAVTLSFQPGQNVPNLWTLFGVPTPHGAQTGTGVGGSSWLDNCRLKSLWDTCLRNCENKCARRSV